jgi:hypothetical protein
MPPFTRHVPIVVSSAAAFDLTTLAWDGFYLADGTNYNGSPWTPTATAGTSGSNGNIITLSAAPTNGTAVNGKTPAAFNGSTQALQLDSAVSTDMWTNAAMTLVVLAKASASTAAASDFYDDPALISDSGGNAALVFTSSGVRAGVFSGSSGQTTHIAQSTGAWFMAALRYNNTNVYCRVASGGTTTDATPVAKGAPSIAANTVFGRNYAGAKFFAGEVLFYGLAKTVFSDADLVNVESGLNSYFGLSL